MKTSVEEITTEIEPKANLGEAIQLSIYPSTNILWLSRFIVELTEILLDDDIRGTILRTFHSFDRGTLITLLL